MNKFGLIGFPLTHSFSKKYFSQKFQNLGIDGQNIYELFEIEQIKDLKIVLENNPDLVGLNVTIPHKLSVIPFLDEIDSAAKEIGAVNVIKISNGKLKGYNSDYYGFKYSLIDFLSGLKPKALVLGTGGASKAVVKVLTDLNIPFLYVSRSASQDVINYQDITEIIADYKLIINTTPLGMYPNIDSCPELPYHLLDASYFLYDLVYNPEETLFMKKGLQKGAKVMHGMQMLVGQAEEAYEIWTN